MIQIAPSILSADFANLGRDIDMINRSDAAMIHCDIMDGVFVPNISFGFPVLKSVGAVAAKPLDVHLMIVDPGKFVGRVRDCGASIMNVHVEACTHLQRVVADIKAAGMKAAVTLNPATPLVMLEDIIGELDMVLLMSVNPGYGGQKLIARTIDKIKHLRQIIDASGLGTLIEVDGGVTEQNARTLAAAGADILVAGNAVFASDDPTAAIHRLASL